MNLLIVDDELWSRKLIRNIIPWEQYQFQHVFEAVDGEQAKDILQKENIHLTITDMRMPGVDGAMLLQHLREIDHKTEVIVMSGYEDYKYLHEALKIKAIDYLLKPVVKDELEKAIKIAIDRIMESKSFQNIQSLLMNDGLKNEFLQYYDYKNQLLHHLSKLDEAEFVIAIDKIDHHLLKKEMDASLIEYIITDLSRLIVKLESENDILNQQYDLVSYGAIKTRLMNLFYSIRNVSEGKKVSILDIQKYIDNHYTEVITLASIAQKFFVSKEHLSRQFKKEVGVTVQNYITKRKIEFCKKLLSKYQHISISGVSVMAGYTDLQYFYRVFKKITGVTPIQFQNNQYNPMNKSI